MFALFFQALMVALMFLGLWMIVGIITTIASDNAETGAFVATIVTGVTAVVLVVLAIADTILRFMPS